MSETVTVRETTHHGQFYNVREFAVSSVSCVRRALADCPYGYASDKAESIYAGLSTSGRAEHGWTRWEVVPAQLRCAICECWRDQADMECATRDGRTWICSDEEGCEQRGERVDA